MAQQMICPGECFVSTWEGCEFLSTAVGQDALYMSDRFIWSIMLFMSTVPLFSVWIIYPLLKVGERSPLLLLYCFFISFFSSVNSLFVYSGAPLLGTYIFVVIISYQWISSFIIIRWSYLSWQFSLLFLLSVVQNVFFQPFAFSLCVSWKQNWVSCRRRLFDLVFIMHSASLCHWTWKI